MSKRTQPDFQTIDGCVEQIERIIRRKVACNPPLAERAEQSIRALIDGLKHISQLADTLEEVALMGTQQAFQRGHN